MMFLSIIIPVFNVEKYIGRCLQSVMSLDLSPSDFEVIVVNDGTKDNSMDVVEKYIEKYANIKRIDQSNRGLSGARNTGFRCASGDYVWFVDSDDFVNVGLTDVVKVCKEQSPDVVLFDICSLMKDGSIKKRKVHPEENGKILSGLAMLDIFATTGVWSYLYRTDFLRKHAITFIEGRLHEDDPYNLMVLSKANKAIYINKCLYNYDRTREGSITNTFGPQRIDAYLMNLELYWNIANNGDFNDKEMSIICRMGGSLFNELVLMGYQKNDEANMELYRLISEKRTLIQGLLENAGSLSYKIESLIMGVNTKLAISLYVQFNKIRNPK